MLISQHEMLPRWPDYSELLFVSLLPHFAFIYTTICDHI